MTEAELAIKFIEYFSDQDVYQEVPMQGICDIVVREGNIITAIEVKQSLNFEVIEQALNNKKYAHYSYVAVPWKKWGYKGIREQILKSLGIGLLTYQEVFSYKNNTKSEIKEVVSPALNRQITKPDLEDWMKRSVAGSQNDRMTAFKHFVEVMQRVVAVSPSGLTVNEVWERTPRHYSTMSSFKSCMIRYCNQGIITNISYDKGKFYYKKPVEQC